MAEQRKDPMEEQERRTQSTRPENWPGIPGRSREHEGEPDSPSKKGDAEVTEAQRELERKSP